jgi:glutamate N-acetyltransferase/amino-acid N-acetyltransferase
MQEPADTIAAPRGFLFAAASAGLRTHGFGPDVALLYSTAPARVAALFTANRVKAAPVLLSQAHLRRSRNIARAVVINAGNANCATGKQGERAARQCADRAAALFRIPKQQVLLASTGVIGVPLDSARITDALPSLARQLHPESYRSLAQAILTTDTRSKVASRAVSISNHPVTILGICKGSGMIYPRLVPHATMLGFFCTDAAVDPKFLQRAAARACQLSFNRISVDGDTSTNDTFYLLANGTAGNRSIREKDKREAREFFEALLDVAQRLAMAMVEDGEGARKIAEIRVEGARTEQQADAVARAIALSPLVKTAMAGADPNWGRILSAAGNAGVDLDPSRVDIFLNGMCVCRRGAAAEFEEAAAARLLREKNILVRVALHHGKFEARFWTCDFTEEYIRINASYRT